MGFVKDKMKGWSEQNPEDAADRTCTRARASRVRRLVENVSGLFTDEDLTRAAEVVRESMSAELPVVVREADVAEGVSGGQRIEMVPDNKVRLDASKFLTAMVEGTPVARQLNVTADFRSLDDERKKAMLGSPLLDEALDELGLEEPLLLENETTSK